MTEGPTIQEVSPAESRQARRFLTIFVLALLTMLVLTRIYIGLAPIAFLESGYGGWAARQTMLRNCDLGDVAVFGDSRAEAAIIPAMLPVQAANISFGATSPMETYYFVRQAMLCPHPPRRVLLVFGSVDFANVSEFLWRNAARYGYIGYRDLREISAVAASLGDHSVETIDTGDGLGGMARDALYAMGFLSIHFNSLLHGEIFRRYDLNIEHMKAVSRARGYRPYLTPNDPDKIGDEAKQDRFTVLPVQDVFFRRTLELLAAHGTRVEYLNMPITASTSSHLTVQHLSGWRAYIASYEAKFPNFRQLGTLPTVWPDRWFNDRHHLGPAGAKAFSAKLAKCLMPEAAGEPCDLTADPE
jgi:hypothetical protein